MPRRTVLALIVAVLLFQCRRGEAERSDPLGVLAEEAFRAYVRIDTSNPPGNETSGARYLKTLLDGEGIETQLLGADPRRQSLYARLSSGTSAPSLLLLSHIDVVPALANEWTVLPFSAEKSGGYIWGRGTQDIKSLTIAQVVSMIDLKRRGVKLTRDVVLLATADEEAGGLGGCAALLASHPQLFANVGVVLNEGGANKTVVDRVKEWGIEVQQKTPLWLRVTTRGAGGHGALPPADGGAIQRLLAVARDLEAIPRPRRLTPVVERQARMQRNASVSDDPHLTRDTMAITTLRAGTGVNSIPTRASADIDCRLVPGRNPDELLQEIVRTVGDRGTVQVLVKGEVTPETSLQTGEFAALQKMLMAAERGSRVVPIVSPGTTDSRFFRSRGVAAYGFSPFKLNYYDYETIHGVDEKMRVTFFHDGVRLMRAVVRGLAAS